MSVDSGLFQKRELTEAEQNTFAELLEAGHSAFDVEDYKLALQHYHEASLLNSAEPEVWSALGLTFTNLDFNREAWRSHKLALAADPDRADSLWYAAEFLFGMEDYELAAFLLERYVQVETDKERLEEGRSMLEECRAHISEHRGELKLEAGADDDDDDDDEEDEEDLEGFGYEDDDEDDFSEDEEDEDDDAEAGLLDDETEGELTFVADMLVQLTGTAAKCSHCGMGIPEDAPFCFGCRAMHFYA